MRTKMIFAIVMAMIFSVALVAQNTNAPGTSKNFYEGQYGKYNSSGRGSNDALVYIDDALENDFVLAGLANLGFNTTVASDWSDFDTKLASGAYGLAVGFRQQWPDWYVPGPNASVVQSYINSGGCFIWDDWDQNAGMASILNASYSGVTNMTPVTVLDPGIATGITNPVALTSPGWGVYSMGMSATGGGQVLATFPNGNAAIIRGNSGKSIILGYLSDTPPTADRQKLFENVVSSTACGKGVPISDWAIYAGLFLMLSFIAFRFWKAS
jgi:hypothetical protein